MYFDCGEGIKIVEETPKISPNIPPTRLVVDSITNQTISSSGKPFTHSSNPTSIPK